jgi:hypothetical protein
LTGVWLRKNYFNVLVAILVSNLILGTFILKYTEPELSWSSAAFVHFTSLTTLGSNIPVDDIAARTYVIVDAMIGLTLIPAISALVAINLTSSDLEQTRARRHMSEGMSRDHAYAIAKIEREAIDVIADKELDAQQKEERLKRLLQKANKIDADKKA